MKLTQTLGSEGLQGAGVGVQIRGRGKAAKAALELGWPHMKLTQKAKCILTKRSGFFLILFIFSVNMNSSPTCSHAVLDIPYFIMNY